MYNRGRFREGSKEVPNIAPSKSYTLLVTVVAYAIEAICGDIFILLKIEISYLHEKQFVQ